MRNNQDFKISRIIRIIVTRCMVVKSGTFYVVVVVVYGVVKSVIGLETTEIVTDITFCQ